jgi:hypothetical protein
LIQRSNPASQSLLGVQGGAAGLGRISGLEDCEHAIADQLENISSAFMNGRDDNLGVVN